MTQTNLNSTQYRNLIVEAKLRLPNSDVKFNEHADSAMSSIRLNGISLYRDGWDYDEFDKKVAAEFWNEIAVLTACLKERGPKIVVPEEWQLIDELSVETLIDRKRQSTALQLWDWYAIPVRHINRRIVLLRAPDDPQFGIPTIVIWGRQSLIDQFGALQAQYAELNDKYRRWERIGSICLVILGVLIFGWITTALSG
jgi:hypothetical protein